MASVAIDTTEIRPAGSAADPAGPAVERPTGRGRTRLAMALAGGAMALGGAAWLAHGLLPSVPQLAGLSSISEPPRPARTDIRIGAFPPMPEIRDGVPALVEPRPVRVVGTAPTSTLGVPAADSRTPLPPVMVADAPPSAARPAGVAPVRGASLLSPSLSAPASMAGVEPVRRMEAASAPVERAGPVAIPAAAPAEPGVAAETPTPPADTSALRIRSSAVPAVAAAPASTPLRAEPAETAALTPVSAPVASVPLPPPAPSRSVRAPETEKPAAPVRTAARPRPTPAPATPAAGDAPPAPVPAEPPAEDRVEVLGMKLPNGRDIGNALSALGDSVRNLPKGF